MGKLNKRFTTALIAVVLILLLSWFLGNLGVSFHRMEGKEPTDVQREKGVDPLEGGLGLALPDYVTSLCLIFVLGVVILFGILYSGSGRVRTRIIQFLLWVSLFILLAAVVRSGIGFSFGGPLPSLPDWTWSGGGAADQADPGFAGTLISMVIVAALISTLLGLLLYQRLSTREEDLGDSDQVVEEDLSTTLDRAIMDLHKGKDVRDVIFRCYLQMCYIMEKQGVTQEKFITPRELRNKAIVHLPVDESIVTDLTTLFEEARYSTHRLGDDKRKKALGDLKNFKEELGV